MNALIPIITLSAMLAALGDDAAPKADNNGSPDAVPVAPAQPPTGEAAPSPDSEAFEKAQVKFDKARKHYAELKQEADEQAAQATQAAVAELAAGRYADRGQNVVRRTTGNPNRALVIRTAEADPKEQAGFEEDLTVMAHLLGKAVKDNLGTGFDRKAMGIEVAFPSGTTPIRSLYLEGYGAVFIVSVTFPVLSSPGDPEAPKEKPAADSSWDEAKREVFGQNGDGRLSAGGAEQFSEEKTEKLKNSLLEALKNASNIRGLKSEDAITVCVLGPGIQTTVKSRGKAKQIADSDAAQDTAPRPGKNVNINKSAARGTIMTLKILKSDVDAFASGKLNLDRFREKARFTSYAGSTMGSAGNMNYFGGSFGGTGYGGSYAVGGGNTP